MKGFTLHAYRRACLNLDRIVSPHSKVLGLKIDLDRWYPFSYLKELEEEILKSYDNPEYVLEYIGEELIREWYHEGPGRDIAFSAWDYLLMQEHSKGYHYIVRGRDEQIGKFQLVQADQQKGKALIESTTPFSRSFEKGTLFGGLMAAGDIAYADIRWDGTYFSIHLL